MNNDTPRTNAHLVALQKEGAYADATAVSADFARELERENAKLRGAIEEVLSHRKEDRDGNYVMWVGEGTFIRCEDALANTRNQPTP